MMADEPFCVRYDATDGILLARLAGFLTTAQAEAFAAAMVAGAATFRRRHGMLRLLVDATQSGVQSADMVSLMIAHNEGTMTAAGDRIAIAAASPLLRMQAKRGATGSHVAVFASIDQARGWIVA